MVRGYSTFICSECKKKFRAMDIEWCCTALSQPMPCPRCGSIRTRPAKFLSFSSMEDKLYEDLWNKMEEVKQDPTPIPIDK